MHTTDPALASLARLVDELWEDPENLRLHDGTSIDAIVSSLESFGQTKNIVAMPDGRVIAGNGTFRAAKTLGWKTIAASTFTGTDEEATRFAIADNRTAELSSWDRNQLAIEVGALTGENEDLAHHIGWTPREIEVMERKIGIVDDRTAERDERHETEREHEASTNAHVTQIEYEAGDEERLLFAFVNELDSQYPDIIGFGNQFALYVEALSS